MTKFLRARFLTWFGYLRLLRKKRSTMSHWEMTGKSWLLTLKMVARITSLDGHIFKKRWIWSCSTSFLLELCPLTIFDQYDFILALYWPLCRKIGRPSPDITEFLIKSLFFIIWHPKFGLAICFQGQLIHLWPQINSEMSPKGVICQFWWQINSRHYPISLKSS